MIETVVVVAGGEAPAPGTFLAIPAGATVIAADGGLEHARALGLDVTLAVGDFDSASSATLHAAEADGTRLEAHPAAKDATDLELALDAALTLAPARVLVVGGIGDRLDHLLSAFLLLGSERYAEVELDALVGPARAHLVRGERTLEGMQGELVSLFALHGPASGVSTEGLVYPLAGETLEPGSTRGVSNVFASEIARVRVEQGVVLALRPGVEQEHAE